MNRRRIVTLGAACGVLLGLALAGIGILLVTGHLMNRAAPGQLDLRMQIKPTVMTVAYKAYGNPAASGGRYWLAKLVMHNSGGQPLNDLSVSYRVPGLIDWTTPDVASEVIPGQTAVLPIYPSFPSSVTRTRTLTPTTLEVRIEYQTDGQKVSRVEKRSFELRGVTEIEFTSIEQNEINSWYDMWDNSELLAAYITDEDEVVKTYFGKISETMGGTPYVQTAEDLAKLLGAVYQFQVASGMVYMGAKGVPETLGDTRTLVQSIKLPREVIQGNSGTCIELTLLVSALLNQCGVKSSMVLIPGHAFPIIQTTNGWVGFETTGIGGANLGGVHPFEKALESGHGLWQKCLQGEMPFMVIDYQDLQAKGIRPPELDPVDTTALVQMLTDRVRHRQRTPEQPQGPIQVDQGGGGSQPRITQPDSQPLLANMKVYQDPTGLLRLVYPEHWIENIQALQMARQGGANWYLFGAVDPQTHWGLDVYGFNSANQQQCLQALSQYAMNLAGVSLQYGQAEQVQLAGRAWTMVPVFYQAQNIFVTSQLYLHTAGNLTYAFGIGGPAETGAPILPVIGQMLNHVQMHQP